MTTQSMNMNYTFDATKYDPAQGEPTHPPGKYQAQIVNTEIKPTKNNDGGMFCVTFKTPVGEITNRYNLWNTNEKTVDIAHRQLSALCHAIGVFNVDMNNGGAAIRGAPLMIEVALQKGQEVGGYTELKKVYDAAGNEPGKAPQAQQPAQSQAFAGQPAQQAPAAAPQAQAPAWNAAPASAPAAQPQQQQAPAWGAAPAAQQPTQPAQQAAATPAWNQAPNAAPAAGGTPPWGAR